MPSEREAYWQDKLATMEATYEERIERLQAMNEELSKEIGRLKRQCNQLHQDWADHTAVLAEEHNAKFTDPGVPYPEAMVREQQEERE